MDLEKVDGNSLDSLHEGLVMGALDDAQDVMKISVEEVIGLIIIN